ncbi:NUDIX hydrolase [Ascidiaceihabitans sp.]|uniref:NUDIX hydrolase n=1 Tax=Ascidiaceihabitans sp. TaxID=1872644 RepID=UPI003298DC37
MSVPMIKQLPISVDKSTKGEMRTQFAALCYRIVNGKVQIMVITSRRSKRWIIPKGWPMNGKTPAQAAAQEAWEEAGVEGKVGQTPLGLYSYKKMKDGLGDLPCLAVVYPLRVKKHTKTYPEAGQRKRKWVSRKRAAKMVAEPELARIIRDFAPVG